MATNVHVTLGKDSITKKIRIQVEGQLYSTKNLIHLGRSWQIPASSLEDYKFLTPNDVSVLKTGMELILNNVSLLALGYDLGDVCFPEYVHFTKGHQRYHGRVIDVSGTIATVYLGAEGSVEEMKVDVTTLEWGSDEA